MKQKITKTLLERFETDRSQVDIWDTQTPAFGVRIARTGRVTFQVIISQTIRVEQALGLWKKQIKRRRVKIGDYPGWGIEEARDEAIRLKKAAGEGKDASRTLDVRSVGALCQIYLGVLEKRGKKSLADDSRRLRRLIVPRLGHLHPNQVTRGHVADIVHGLNDQGKPYEANQALSQLRTIFDVAVERKVIEDNPALGIKFPGKVEPRKRWLTEDEIPKFWSATQRMMDESGTAGRNIHRYRVGLLYRLRLLTAQRENEIRHMRKSDIKEVPGMGLWWEIPGEFTKNGKDHNVPLSEPAWSIVKELAELCGGSEWMFPGSDPRQPRDRLTREAGIVRRLAGIDEYWSPRDLRRTASTWMQQLGINPIIVSQTLNHTPSRRESDIPMVTWTYARHDYPAERKQALEKLGAFIEGLVQGESDALDMIPSRVVGRSVF